MIPWRRQQLLIIIFAMLATGCTAETGRRSAPPPPPPSAGASAVGRPAAAPIWSRRKAASITRAQRAAATMDRLIGLNEGELEKVLGAPMLEENRAPNKIWVYRDKHCTIDVTLYPDVETRQFQALSYEVISDVHNAERTRECIAEFAARVSPN